MIHDYDKDLTLAVSGTGVFDEDNVADNIFDFVLGAKEQRHCTLVIPLLSKMTANMKNFTAWAIVQGFDDFIFVQSENAPMTREISGLSKKEDVQVQFIKVETDRDAIQQVFSILAVAKDAGEDYAFSMMYNPESTYDRHATPPSDYEILGEAKFLKWLPTYNICEGMVDSFEGYESAEEKEIRLKAEQEFAEKQAQESPQQPRKRVARKTAAKKTTPAKTEAQKPTQGLDKLIADAVERDKAQPKQETDDGLIEQDHRNPGPTLSATVSMKSYAQADAETTQDLWKDVQAEQHKFALDSAKRMVPLVKQLAGNIQDLTNAFNAALNTMTEMIDVLSGE